MTDLPHTVKFLAAFLLVDVRLRDVRDESWLVQELPATVPPPADHRPALAGLLARLVLDGAVRRVPLRHHRVRVGGHRRAGLQLGDGAGTRAGGVGVGVGRRQRGQRLHLYLIVESLLV